MRLFRTRDAGQEQLDGQHDDELDLDLAQRAEPVPGRRSRVMRKADRGDVRPRARTAVARAAERRGEPLSDAVRLKLERALGVDLSGVRVHTDQAADDAARAIAAHAYTIGQDIYFASGQYDPASASGFHLLTHEVAHTVQQGEGAQGGSGELAVSEPGDALELEAERVADAVADAPDADEVGAVAGAIEPSEPGLDPTQARIDASHAASRALSAATGPGPVAQRDGNGGDSSGGGDAQSSGAAPTLTWSTEWSAPSGGTNRFTVGPGESMTFTGSAKGTWTASGGEPTSGDENTDFKWKAPNTVGIYTIKLTADGKDVQQGVSVLAPTTVTFAKSGSAGEFADDQAGVGMSLTMKIGPTNASFQGIQVQEKPGNAASATGVFAKMPNAHEPNATWNDVNDGNELGQPDDAWAGPFNQPVEMGKLVWNIPYLWQASGGGGGGSFAIVNQSMEVVDSKGTMTIIKGNASASRTPKPKPKPAGGAAAGGDGKAAGGAGGDAQPAGGNGGDAQ